MVDPKKEMSRKIKKLADRGSVPPIPKALRSVGKPISDATLGKDFARDMVRRMAELKVDEVTLTGDKIRDVVGTAVNNNAFRDRCREYGIILRKIPRQDIYIIKKKSPARMEHGKLEGSSRR